MIDTHCHLYLPEFEEDLEKVLKRGTEAGVRAFYLPAIDSTTHEAMIRLEDAGQESVMPWPACIPVR